VRLSKFIETKLNCHYEDGKAFYEGTPVEDKEEIEEDLDAPEREEDLLYYKKILRPKVFIRHTHGWKFIVNGKFHDNYAAQL
jgi:hypothetical protein